jgi:crossover junction endodeoxyribonuclease RusA
MKSLDLLLPYPPSVNQYWRHRIIKGKTSFVSVYVSSEGVKYQRDVHASVLKQIGKQKPIENRVAVVIQAQMPSKHRRDLDNILKATLDSLTKAGVWLDDEQIDRLEVVRCGVKKPGGIRVLISELKPAETQAAFW